MKLCTECERNRSIYGGVIEISIFDLITLNAVTFDKLSVSEL